MAKKKVMTKATPSSNLPAVNDADLLKYAQRETEREHVSAGASLSLKKGRFRFKGADLGEEIEVVALDYRFINALYDGPFSDDNPTAPGCFAIAEDSTALTAHASSQNPFGGGEAADTCEVCWANQWNSDLKGGKGKACKNTRRVAVIHRDSVDEGMKGDPTIVMLSVPPTSTGAWSSYVNKLASGMKKPQFAFITKVSFDDSVDYPKLKFEASEEITDREILAKIIAVRKSVQDALDTPFDPASYTAPPEQKRGGKKTAQKPAPRRGGKSKFS